MAQTLRVLIVEDEPLLGLLLQEIAKDAGAEVLPICYDSTSALVAIRTAKPDLIFMDINIKGPLDGISVIQNATTKDSIVYYISAYSDESIIQEALATKPYNYLIKPIKEHDIRIALSLAGQRNTKGVNSSEKIFLGKTSYYDCKFNEVFQGVIPISLTAKEKELIRFFAQNINIILSPQVIKEALWGDNPVKDSTLRTFVSSLRQKIPEANIKTSFGQGYMLTN